MKKVLILIGAILVSIFLVLLWHSYYPQDNLNSLLLPKVFDYPMVTSTISFGLQNGITTVLILTLFASLVFSEPIAHLFIKDGNQDAFQAFEARHFWQTLVLIPLFSLPFVWVFHRFGIFKIHADAEDVGYMILQFTGTVIVHDTYFYWCHRLLHTKPFWRVHGIHHKAKDPTLLTSHVFHYVETFINYSFIVWFTLGMGLLFGRIYYLPFMVFVAFTISWNIYGHGKRNILPTSITNSWVGKCIAWPSYHWEHHRKGKENFEFFFTFWDRWCRTGTP